jgi:pyrroline-5-carboxylate reductase
MQEDLNISQLGTLGFVGCGTIAAAIVTGLRAAGHGGLILLSPRNAEIAAGLAARFDNIKVMPSNQAVLDGSETVALAVRPQIAAGVLAELRFKPEHHVLSLIATTPLAWLRAATAPAGVVTRAIPLPAVALRQGPTAIYPPDVKSQALFDSLGTAVALTDEGAFDTFLAATAFMASHFRFAGAVADWMAAKGVAPSTANLFMTQMLQGMAETKAGSPDGDFTAIAVEHQTAGGLNEQIARQLTDRGVFAAVPEAMEAVLARLRAAKS